MPVNEHAPPVAPVRLQYFILAPLPVVGHVIVVGQVLPFVVLQLT
jgi:hypothetical protein